MMNSPENYEVILLWLTSCSKTAIFRYFRKKLTLVFRDLNFRKFELYRFRVKWIKVHAETLLQGFLKTHIKKSGHMKNEFDSLEVSTARKLDILCNSLNQREKYIGKKTDIDRTIRNDFLKDKNSFK